MPEIIDSASVTWSEASDELSATATGRVTGVTVDDDGTIGSASDPDAITIDSSGNVGIGTATPGAELEVNGDIIADGVYLGGTAAANLLDDYEEGTWTPTMANASISAASGTYTKIGDTVFFWGTIVFGAATDSNDLIGGVPFSISGAESNRGIGNTSRQDAVSNTQFGLYERTSTEFSMHNGDTVLNVTGLSGSSVWFNGQYKIL